ncbi:hypothetical protein [Sterolibacterium denitrificans]|uniref:hypothetical protein n=1 Tax=Sterolibacterium denitrificans TaxID=157592 RepID=UPI00128E9FF7|nr:hypothetical protein [Sterolibacterium denitrificans]
MLSRLNSAAFQSAVTVTLRTALPVTIAALHYDSDYRRAIHLVKPFLRTAQKYFEIGDSVLVIVFKRFLHIKRQIMVFICGNAQNYPSAIAHAGREFVLRHRTRTPGGIQGASMMGHQGAAGDVARWAAHWRMIR